MKKKKDKSNIQMEYAVCLTYIKFRLLSYLEWQWNCSFIAIYRLKMKTCFRRHALGEKEDPLKGEQQPVGPGPWGS